MSSENSEDQSEDLSFLLLVNFRSVSFWSFCSQNLQLVIEPGKVIRLVGIWDLKVGKEHSRQWIFLLIIPDLIINHCLWLGINKLDDSRLSQSRVAVCHCLTCKGWDPSVRTVRQGSEACLLGQKLSTKCPIPPAEDTSIALRTQSDTLSRQKRNPSRVYFFKVLPEREGWRWWEHCCFKDTARMLPLSTGIQSHTSHLICLLTALARGGLCCFCWSRGFFCHSVENAGQQGRVNSTSKHIWAQE